MRGSVQHAGDVGPVLVEVRVDGAGHDGAGDVGAASGKGADAAVRVCPVEAGDHGPLHLRQAGGHLLVGSLGVKDTVLVEENHLCRVDKLISQELGHDVAV